VKKKQEKKLNRSRDYYRHHRERAIARKVHIYTNIMGNDLMEYRNGRDFPTFRGRFSKGKVHCSCKWCKYEKHYDLEKEKYKAKKNQMKKEIEEYVSEWHR